jgi:hypothetical protein
VDTFVGVRVHRVAKLYARVAVHTRARSLQLAVSTAFAGSGARRTCLAVDGVQPIMYHARRRPCCDVGTASVSFANSERLRRRLSSGQPHRLSALLLDADLQAPPAAEDHRHQSSTLRSPRTTAVPSARHLRSRRTLSKGLRHPHTRHYITLRGIRHSLPPAVQQHSNALAPIQSSYTMSEQTPVLQSVSRLRPPARRIRRCLPVASGIVRMAKVC